MIKFYGHTNEPYWFLSNFFPVNIRIDGVMAASAEHWYQAMKTLDLAERFTILDAATPGKAKRLGSKCTLRDDWNSVVGNATLHDVFRDDQGIVLEFVKDHFMFSGLIAKFTQEDLRGALIQTGDEDLVENSPTDFYWGIGDGSGLNKLGRMLKLIRHVLPNRQIYNDGSLR